MKEKKKMKKMKKTPRMWEAVKGWRHQVGVKKQGRSDDRDSTQVGMSWSGSVQPASTVSAITRKRSK